MINSSGVSLPFPASEIDPVPSSVKQYAWINPLRPISFHDLTSLIPKEDHDFVSIVYPDSKTHFIQDDNRASVWLAVNDPTYPPASGGALTYNTSISTRQDISIFVYIPYD